jgi:hypothetical protein
LRYELARRLGKAKCCYITYNGKKDSNELLFEEGNESLLKLLDNVIEFPIEGIVTVKDVYIELEREYIHGKPKGYSLGWKCLDPHFTLRFGDLIIGNGYPGSGKALDIDTDIPTPFGFTKMKDLKIGDKVFDENGNECNVIYTTDVMYNRPCYEIEFSDHTKIKCDEEHLWFVYNREARSSRNRHIRHKPRTVNTSGIDQQHLMIQPKVVTTKEIYENIKSCDSSKNNYSIDVSLPIKYSEKELKLHPYLLGLWLGDGTTHGPRLTIGNEDELFITSKVKELGYTLRKQKAKFMYGIIGIIDIMRNYNLISNKHIPQIYLTSSIEQRIDLLSGLLDTDGTIDKKGRIELSLSDEKLAMNAFTLIKSLGIKAYCNKNKSYLNGKNKKDRYRIGFTTNLDVFKNERKKKYLRKDIPMIYKYRYIINCKKIDSIPVRCIQVDSKNKLYLASKSFIPTHNTTFTYNIVINTAILYNWKWGMYCPENYPERRVFDSLAEVLIGNSSDMDYKARMTLKEYKSALMDFIQKHVYLIRGNKRYSPKDINNIGGEMIAKLGIVGLIKDPWNSLKHTMKNRSLDDYLEDALSDENEFATKNEIINLIVAHPPTPPRDKLSSLPCPTYFMIRGGAIWAAKGYAIYALHQRNYGSYDVTDTTVEFHMQKSKDHKSIGRPTSESNPILLTYKRASNRFYELSNEKGGKYLNPIEQHKDIFKQQLNLEINE